MQKIPLLISMCLTLTACQQSDAGAKEAVLQGLKDPDSAKFGRIQEVASGVACVEVNAKNSFGGYAGESTFGVKQMADEKTWVPVQEFPEKRGFPDCVIALSEEG